MAQSTFSSTSSSIPLPDVFSSALTELFETARPGIVQIRNEQRGGGTGFVWHSDGRIITNNHVVPNDQGKIQVHFTDGRTLAAQVLHRNPDFDLAVLKIPGDNFQALVAGDSAKLRVGEWVFAIGHPWGQRWALTAGIVSTISTVQFRDGTSTQYIKSDARLAPGNSGGPLLDADGKVVGINAMIFGGDQSVSIPVNVLSDWLAHLPKKRAVLGIGVQTIELPANIRQGLQPDRTTGLLIASTQERAAYANDLFIGDILLDIAGVAIDSTTALRNAVASKGAGETLSIKLARGGTITNVDAVLLTLENAS
jgi:serine protease Do